MQLHSIAVGVVDTEYACGVGCVKGKQPGLALPVGVNDNVPLCGTSVSLHASVVIAC